MDNRNIIRVEKNRNYTVINNTSIHDDRLSWKAKAIHVFMLSKPDDWTFYNEEVAKWAKDGIDSFNSGLKELKKYGYVRKERRKGEGGKFDWVTVVYEVPQIDDPVPDKPYPEKPSMEKPYMENPSMEKPSMENPRLLSTDPLSTDIPNTNKQNTDSSMPSIVDFNFQRLVNFYHQNVGPLYPVLREELGYLLDTYQNTELIITALTKAVSINANNKLKYTEATLRNWRNENITSVEMLKAKEVQRNGSTQKRYAAGDGYKADLGF